MKILRFRFGFCHLFCLSLTLTLFVSCEQDGITELDFSSIKKEGTYIGDPDFEIHTNHADVITSELKNGVKMAFGIE